MVKARHSDSLLKHEHPKPKQGSTTDHKAEAVMVVPRPDLGPLWRRGIQAKEWHQDRNHMYWLSRIIWLIKLFWWGSWNMLAWLLRVSIASQSQKMRYGGRDGSSWWTVANNGLEALQKIRKVSKTDGTASGQTFDCVIMDLEMPGMSHDYSILRNPQE
jgi:hypothetical protein